MIVFHGTSKIAMDKILSDGFDKSRWIMFADKKEEAARYAQSYSRTDNSSPCMITLDLSKLNIQYDLEFNEAKSLYNEGKLDGNLSDRFERNKLANYFVIYNIDKLNEL